MLSVYHSYLEENTSEYLNELLQTKVEDESSYYYEARFSKTKKSDSSKKIIDIVKPYFEKAGLVINENNGYITYHCDKNVYDRTCGNDEYECDVNLCYIITKQGKKENNIKIYDSPVTLLELLSVTASEKVTIDLEKSSIVVVKGDLYHTIGNGDINFIRVVFYKNKREGYMFDNDEEIW